MGKEAVRDLKKETRHRETEREWKKEGLHKMKEELTAGMNKQNINKGIEENGTAWYGFNGGKELTSRRNGG